mmetsp:Transcript_5665/g.11994  ORF Transcript_5665/g.11994 Transcript_5665/m.11994 type:complete len:80 (+) Transcript_5665:921-1160(+)
MMMMAMRRRRWLFGHMNNFVNICWIRMIGFDKNCCLLKVEMWQCGGMESERGASSTSCAVRAGYYAQIDRHRNPSVLKA